MLLAQASMRIRLGEWLLIWPKTPSVCMRVRCPQESLAQAGQFLRLGSLAHPLYIILAFRNTVSCCTNFWRLLGGPGGLSERTSQILRIQIFRGGKWKMTGFQSGKRCWLYQSMESFPSFWLLLIYNTVGTRCGSSCQRESEDSSKAAAGSLKKLKGQTADGKGRCGAAIYRSLNSNHLAMQVLTFGKKPLSIVLRLHPSPMPAPWSPPRWQQLSTIL